MTDQEIARQLCAYIESELATGVAAGTIKPDSQLIEEGFVDSLGLFKLVEYLEDRLKVTLDPEEIVFENFATVNDIMKLIESRKPGSA